MAVIVILALLALVLVFISANVHALANLDRELKAINQRQVQRLDRTSAKNSAGVPLNSTVTNSPAPAAPSMQPADP